MNEIKWTEEEISSYASIISDYLNYAKENSKNDINEIPEIFLNKKN